MAVIKRINLLIISMLLFYGTACDAQTLDEIARMKQQCKSCLDSGVDMQGCARKYSIRMYEMVDTAYDNLSKKLSQKERASLKNDQMQWLQKRDKFEKEQVKEFQKKIKSEEWGYDMFMIVYENDAEFTRKRVVDLIKMRNKYLNKK